jgi:hypothetical protein
LTPSIYALGGGNSLQSILHPCEGWETNDLTDSGIDLLETSDNAISQSARGTNWYEIDSLSAPDAGDVMSKEPLQNKNAQFAR